MCKHLQLPVQQLSSAVSPAHVLSLSDTAFAPLSSLALPVAAAVHAAHLSSLAVLAQQ
jgi:hypothetical protein